MNNYDFLCSLVQGTSRIKHDLQATRSIVPPKASVELLDHGRPDVLTDPVIQR